MVLVPQAPAATRKPQSSCRKAGCGPWTARLGTEGRLEPAEVDLLDEPDIDRPGSFRGRYDFKPTQDVLPAVLNFLSGRERVVAKLG